MLRVKPIGPSVSFFDADAHSEPKRRDNNADASDERKRRKLNTLDNILRRPQDRFDGTKLNAGKDDRRKSGAASARSRSPSLLSLRRFRSSLASA
jgi:hypothetical protein